MSAYIIPCLFAFLFLFSLANHYNPYQALIRGAEKGLKVTAHILPPLVALMTVIAMLRASGALDALTVFLTPLADIFHIPPEVLPLMALRPLSGSGALAVGAEIMSEYGADSTIGRTAAVMLGSTETTFYTIAVYFGAAGITKTRYTVPAALMADFAGFLAAALTVQRIF